MKFIEGVEREKIKDIFMKTCLNIQDLEISKSIRDRIMVKRYRKKEIICREGDLIDRIPFNVKGAVKCISWDPEGKEILICAGGEDYLPAIPPTYQFGSEERFDFDLIALTDVVICFLSSEDARDLSQMPVAQELINRYRLQSLELHYGIRLLKSLGERLNFYKEYFGDLWDPIDEKDKALILEITPSHWSRYKKSLDKK